MPEHFLHLPAQYNLSVISATTAVNSRVVQSKKMMGLAKWCEVRSPPRSQTATATDSGSPSDERRITRKRQPASGTPINNDHAEALRAAGQGSSGCFGSRNREGARGTEGTARLRSSYTFRTISLAAVKKTAFLLRNDGGAGGNRSQDRTGAIEFIGFSSSQIQQNSHSIQMQAQI
jgi:hypothetical protein